MNTSAMIERIKAMFAGGGNKKKAASGDGPSLASVLAAKNTSSSGSASSASKVLMGPVGSLGEFYFPPDVIGGTCPRVLGEEEEIVWNAAAETCDSERVHVAWQSMGGKIWYLAVRSQELASRSDSWCPFASLLPGMKDALPSPVCYTYYGDEIATMMTVTDDGLQIYRGTNLVVRAKAERMARELGGATVVELVPDRIMTLTPLPWYSLTLFEDRARRILAAISVMSALVILGLSFLVWLLTSMSLISARHDLSNAMSRTEDKTLELMKTVVMLRASPIREQLANFSDLNDGLLDLNGFLDVYEIKNNRARWRANVPPNVTADRINQLGGKTMESKPNGGNTVIGNSAQIEFEASGEGKKK